MDQGGLARTASFETLKNIKGYQSMKLFKATRKQHGEVTCMLMVPATAWQTTRPDGTASLTIVCHTAILSKVSEPFVILCLTSAHTSAILAQHVISNISPN